MKIKEARCHSFEARQYSIFLLHYSVSSSYSLKNYDIRPRSISMITKVGMIILLEHDVDAAVAFYKKLGLKTIFHLKESWAEFAIGDVKIGLCPTKQEPRDRITGLVLEVDDIRKFYADYKDELPFRSAPLEKVHGIMASIQDPGGNIIDLYQPTPEKVQNLVKDVVKKDEKRKKDCNPDNCRCKQPKASA